MRARPFEFAPKSHQLCEQGVQSLCTLVTPSKRSDDGRWRSLAGGPHPIHTRACIPVVKKASGLVLKDSTSTSAQTPMSCLLHNE